MILNKDILSEFFETDYQLYTFDRRWSESNSSIMRKIYLDELISNNIIIQWAPFDWIEFPIHLKDCYITVKCKRKFSDKEMFSIYYNKTIYEKHYDDWEKEMSKYKKPIREFLKIGYNPDYYIDQCMLIINYTTDYLLNNNCKVINMIPNLIIQHEDYRHKKDYLKEIKNHSLYKSLEKKSVITINHQEDNYW
jgi:hypothetical protein